MRDPKCSYCLADIRALSSWRIKGGAMPAKTCPIDHRKPCKNCKALHENRASGLCDKCWSAPKASKPKRFNPLDLVRGRK